MLLGHRYIALYLQVCSNLVVGIDTHPACLIGKGIMLKLDFCGSLEGLWSWPRLLPDAHLIATRYDHHALRSETFSHCGIAMPTSLQGTVDKRRAEFLAGRLCARQALLELDGREATPGVGEDREPLWPEDCVGSITHTHDWAAAMVAHQHKYHGLGLDVEHLLNSVDVRKLAGEILTTGESVRLARLSSEHQALAVTLTFSLKESLFKALYPLVRRFFYFEHAELVYWDETGKARMRLLCNLDHEWLAGRELDAQFCQFGKHLLSLVAIPAPNLRKLYG